MSDLISRQEAIDALGDEPEVWNDTDAEWAEHDAWVMHKVAIESLPSAETQPITCDGCKHVGTYDTDFPCSSCIRRARNLDPGWICGPDRSDPRWLPGGSSEIPTMIGSFIRKKRKEKGLTQKDLAKRINVTQGQISQWENSRMLQMSTIEKIALALDCSFVNFIYEYIVLYEM